MKADVAKKAKETVTAIVADLQDRRGLRQAWDSIDQDIREEILAEWRDIVEEKMREAAWGEER